LEPPTLEQFRDFFHAHPLGEERAHAPIRIDVFSPLDRLLAKIVQHNLWPTVRRSKLILKRARFLNAILMRMPFCLCKHILNRMLEMRDDHSIGLPFACLDTKIILQSELDISAKPKMRLQDPFCNQTLMKSNAQLRHEGQDEAPQPPLV